MYLFYFPTEFEVGKVEAIDRDRDSTIFYTIVGGNTGNKFVIDSETGIITTVGELDRETRDSYTLRLEARDENVDQYRDTASVSWVFLFYFIFYFLV